MKGLSREKLLAVLSFVVVVAAVSLVGLFIHELGHGITAEVLDGEFKGLYVFPGVQIWPNLGERYDGEWGAYVGRADTDPGKEWGERKEGLVWLMGSGANLVLAMMALVSLWVFRPRGWLSQLLLAEALMYVDILLYTILPEWFGLRHWFFFGGRCPEPLDGAELMGFPRGMFVVLILVISAVMTVGVIAHVLRSRALERSQGIEE